MISERFDYDIPETSSQSSSMRRELTLIALSDFPEVIANVDLAALVLTAIDRMGQRLHDGDIVVIAQKIVSKAEGRFFVLGEISPSERARKLAITVDKDPRLVELILRESREVLRSVPGVLITEHRLGFVMANAGVDQSNVPGTDVALLLPCNPDASARKLADDLSAACGARIGVVINDSFGRAWRHGVVGTAIGVAGMPALVDLRGRPDREGRSMKVTQVAAADELAAAASLLMGQADEGCPAVLVRGFPYALRESKAAELVRPHAEDLFR
jgi:coenzyme F420-0:L-glutamate ligase/coenzyme F420-1:gamma-L-glutamate ligase